MTDVQDLDEATTTEPDLLEWDSGSGQPHPWLDRDRPAWSEPECDEEATTATLCRWRSEPRSIPTSAYRGRMLGGELSLAHLDVDLALSAAFPGAQPRVTLRQIEWDRTGKFSGGYVCTLTLEEATELAHVLNTTVQQAETAGANQ